MDKRIRPFLPTIIILISLFLAACSGTVSVATAIPTATMPLPTDSPTETAVPPTPTATSELPTATMELPTATIEIPTETAVPSTAVPSTAVPSTAVPTLESAQPSIATTVETLVVELPSATGGLTIDTAGNIYVGDMGLAPSRRGTTVWQVTPDGEFSVYAEGQGLLGASGNIMLPNGTLYQSSFTGGTVSRITADGTVTEIANDNLNGPVGLTVDEVGNLVVADCRGAGLDKISPDGTVTLFSTSSLFRCPNGITRDPAGYFYVLNFHDGKLLRVSPDGVNT